MADDKSLNTQRKKARKSPAISTGMAGIGKKPPQAIELEEAVLGACMLEQTAVNAVIDILEPAAFYALVRKEDFLAEKWESHGMQWVPIDRVPDLAFDHNDVVTYARERLKRRVKRRPVGFHLLPSEFTLGQLQSLYEQALGKTFDKRNFRKKLFKSPLLTDLEKKATGGEKGQHKGSRLYTFDRERYQRMKSEGYDFLF